MVVRLLSNDASETKIPKIAQIICDNLRRKIVTGLFTTGDKLPAETELIKQFGASRPSVREALRLLEAEGLIVLMRGAHGGARVSDPGVTAMAHSAGVYMKLNDVTVGDVYRARMMIEPPAVKILAEVRDPIAIKALRGKIDEERSALNDVDALAKGPAQFHFLLVELTGNKTLTMFTKMIVSIVEAHHAKVISSKGAVTREIMRAKRRAIASHEHVVDLIEAGMDVEAEDFWQTHMEKAAITLLKNEGRRVVDLFS